MKLANKLAIIIYCILIVGMISYLCIGSFWVKYNLPDDNVEVPKELYTFFNSLDKQMSDSEKAEFKETDEDELYECVSGGEYHIKNQWFRDHELNIDVDLSIAMGDLGVITGFEEIPIIITSYHRYLNNREINLAAQVEEHNRLGWQFSILQIVRWALVITIIHLFISALLLKLRRHLKPHLYFTTFIAAGLIWMHSTKVIIVDFYPIIPDLVLYNAMLLAGIIYLYIYLSKRHKQMGSQSETGIYKSTVAYLPWTNTLSPKLKRILGGTGFKLANKLAIIIFCMLAAGIIFYIYAVDDIIASKLPHSEVPKELSICFEDLDKTLDEDFKAELKNVHEDDIGSYHFGFGMYIRNEYLRSDKLNVNLDGVLHDLRINYLDRMSGIIITSYHRYLNNIEVNLKAQIEMTDPLSSYFEMSGLIRRSVLPLTIIQLFLFIVLLILRKYLDSLLYCCGLVFTGLLWVVSVISRFGNYPYDMDDNLILFYVHILLICVLYLCFCLYIKNVYKKNTISKGEVA